jgi:ankyrin repeat protein
LLNAVKGNYGNVASYLVEHGADPNDLFTDEKNKKHNLLMDAIVVANKEFALLLIEKGANVSYADSEGNECIYLYSYYYIYFKSVYINVCKYV